VRLAEAERAEMPEPRIKKRIGDRVFGAGIAAAIAALTTGIMTNVGTLAPLSAAMASAVATAMGALLAPSLRDASRGRLLAVGGVAGFLVLPGFGLLAGLGRFGMALATYTVTIGDALGAFAGLLFHPFVFVIFGFPAVLVLVPGGIAWAFSTHRVIRDRRGDHGQTALIGGD
jgi:hypothetical protein